MSLAAGGTRDPGEEEGGEGRPCGGAQWSLVVLFFSPLYSMSIPLSPSLPHSALGAPAYNALALVVFSFPHHQD